MIESMSWQIIITLQVIVGSFLTIIIRYFSLRSQKAFFSIGAFSYLAIALVGALLSLAVNHQLPALPSLSGWLYLIGVGLAIPVGWLAQYRLISLLGASNAVLIGTINSMVAALFGIVFLQDHFSVTFMIGTVLLIGSSALALRIKPDAAHHDPTPLMYKLLLIGLGTLAFAVGMVCEKQAITSLGVWNYAFYGWTMQAIGAFLLLVIFGRHDRKYITKSVAKQGLLIGFLTSISGSLFIYALSLGSLSHTIIGSTGKVALTMIIAAIVFKERNALVLRITALVLSICGLWCIVG